MSPMMETEYCEHCNAELDAGQIGLCDDCQEIHCGAKKAPESAPDHKYIPGPYGVCRRCGGEQHGNRQ